MDRVHIDASDLARLGVDLAGAGVRALPDVRNIGRRGAINIQRGARRRWSGNAHAPLLPGAVTYDVWNIPYGVVAEVGPDKGKRQGALGNLFEYGSVNNAPIPGLAPELELERPRFLKALEDAAQQAVLP